MWCAYYLRLRTILYALAVVADAAAAAAAFQRLHRRKPQIALDAGQQGWDVGSENNKQTRIHITTHTNINDVHYRNVNIAPHRHKAHKLSYTL